MADKKITQLTPIVGADLVSADEFVVVDVSTDETKSIVLSELIAGIAALPKSGGAMTGAITTNSTFDGRDVATDGTKLDTIATNATADQTFNQILSKTGGTGEYSTTGALTAGRNSGGVSLTINDGYGNANLTFNHKNGVPEQAGNGGRISVNTDGPSAPSMSFQLGTAVTAGVAYVTTQEMKLESTGLNVTNNITLGGTVDGRDVAADGSKLDGIEGSAGYGTQVATTSGTAFDFTSIPSGVNKVTMVCRGVSLSGDNLHLIQLGTSAGIVASGYVGAGGAILNSTFSTRASSGSGLVMRLSNSARNMNGSAVFTRMSSGGTVWAAQAVFGDANGVYMSGTSVDIGGELTQVRLTRDASDTFVSGAANISWSY